MYDICVTREGEEECQDTQVVVVTMMLMTMMMLTMMMMMTMMVLVPRHTGCKCQDCDDDHCHPRDVIMINATFNQVDSLTQVPEEVILNIFLSFVKEFFSDIFLP